MADNKTVGNFINHPGTQYQDPRPNKFTRSDNAHDADSPHEADKKEHHGEGKGPHYAKAKLSKKERQKTMQRGLVPTLAGCSLAILFIFSCVGKLEASGIKGTISPKTGTNIVKACTNFCDTLINFKQFDAGAKWKDDYGFNNQKSFDSNWKDVYGFKNEKSFDAKREDYGFNNQKSFDGKWKDVYGFKNQKSFDAKRKDYGFNNQKSFDGKWKDDYGFKNQKFDGSGNAGFGFRDEKDIFAKQSSAFNLAASR